MKDKNVSVNKYKEIRESLHLTRDQAVEAFDNRISYDRLVRIESDKFDATPEEIQDMSEVYNAPELCNYYCTNKCKIGEKIMREIKIADISQIVLEMIDSLNQLDKEKSRIIQIAVDGEISDDEIPDFIKIQNELDRISMTVDSLQLWVERMKNSGKLNKELYDNLKKELN